MCALAIACLLAGLACLLGAWQPWASLGRPRVRDFGHASTDPTRFNDFATGGSTEPTAYSHYICDTGGRTLYRIGPWYPTRRAPLRQVRERIRAAHADR